MSEPEHTLDADFEEQLRGLFEQAERAIEHRSAPSPLPEPAPAAPEGDAVKQPEPGAAPEESAAAVPTTFLAKLSLPQLLRPVVQGLEAVSRTASENTAILKKLDASSSATAEAREDLPQVIADLRTLLEMKNGLNQSMFAALHQELKGYKDGFLLESVHRPIIRDLISVYDDIVEIQRQLATTVGEIAVLDGLPESATEMVARLRTLEMNLEHKLEFIIEVLARLDVTPMEPQPGKLDKRTQRAVSIDIAEDPDADNEVLRTVRRGFMWKDRVLRAEEVVIKKWKEGYLVALTPQA